MHSKKRIIQIAIISVAVTLLFGAVFFIIKNYGKDESTKRSRRSTPDLKTLNRSEEFDIPDITNTDVDGDICNCMTPQGICVAGDYILITAYCNIESYKEELNRSPYTTDNIEKIDCEQNHERHNSVMYVLDGYSKEHISTLVFDDKSHVGGITFDGTYVWVAKGGNCKIEAYSYSYLERLIQQDAKSVELGKPQYEFKGECTASFLTYYNGCIWVGTFNSDPYRSGVLIGYAISHERGLRCLNTYKIIEIPPQANGAAFVEVDGTTYLAITTSYGRNNNSCLYIYDVVFTIESVLELNACKIMELPPMAEEICVAGDNMYFLFESGSTAYSSLENNKCENVVNTVRVNNIRELIYMQ